jgi:hypothetical protein
MEAENRDNDVSQQRRASSNDARHKAKYVMRKHNAEPREAEVG